MTVYSKECKQPWFGYIFKGIKTIEGRLFKGDWAKMVVGDRIEFYVDDQRFVCEIIALWRKSSFKELIEQYQGKILPGVDLSDVQNGVDVYRQYFKESDEQKYGVVGVEIKVL